MCRVHWIYVGILHESLLFGDEVSGYYEVEGVLVEHVLGDVDFGGEFLLDHQQYDSILIIIVRFE